VAQPFIGSSSAVVVRSIDRVIAAALAGMVIVSVTVLAALGAEWLTFFVLISQWVTTILGFILWGELKSLRGQNDQIKDITNGNMQKRDAMIQDLIEHLKTLTVR
jgi:hypothetical protein